MQSPDWIDVVVAAIEREAPLVRAIRLEREHGAPLPSWQAGAHVKVRLPDGDTRSYSLTGFSADPAATTRPGAYLLGVRLEEGGKGGSRFMHGLAVGDRLSISAPANNSRWSRMRPRSCSLRAASASPRSPRWPRRWPPPTTRTA